MSFIKRIGTEEVHFNIEIHIQKLSLNINAPDCLVHILFQRGERKIQTSQPALLQNRMAVFNEVLELPITLYHDRKKKTYQEKNGTLFILLQGARGIKKAGEIHLEFSQYLNQNIFFKGEVLSLEKCPDPRATLQLSIVLGSNNVTIQDRPLKLNLTQLDQVEEEVEVDACGNFDRSPTSPTKERKKTGYPKKKLNIKDSHDGKGQVSINLIGSQADISPISKGQRREEDYVNTIGEISSINDFLETKEELKYLRIEMGQFKNTMVKLKLENTELLDKIKQLQGLIDLTNIENKQLEDQIKKSKLNLDDENDRPFNYGSNIELQQVLLENKRLKDTILKVRKENDVLQEQIGGCQNFDISGRSSDITDDERNRLMHKITELEQRLQNDPNVQENKLSKLAIENEQLKRKMQDLSNRHDIEIGKLNDQHEDAMQDAIKFYVEQVETLTHFKDKYENMNSQFRKNQGDLEALRSSKFEVEDKVLHKQQSIQQLENELLKAKQNIAGAMTEFLNYGDPFVIEVMEYYMT